MKVASAWSGHDCSFCILDNGEPVVHAEYERYIREKEPYGDGVKFMFDEMGDVSDVKHFVTNFSFNKLKAYPESLGKITNIVQSNGGNIHVISHHQAHAANAFFSSNYDSALVFTMDGGGMESEEGFITAFTVNQKNYFKISCNFNKKNIKPHVKSFLSKILIRELNLKGISFNLIF